jgi:23S rRNA pseudouridine2457 synthase
LDKYFIVYKPFHVLSQFSREGDKKTLKDFFDVPTDVYPVGRLDYDSEGLLILSNDKKLNQFFLDPAHQHEREYWVQVEGDVDEVALSRLCDGVPINLNGKIYRTEKCFAAKLLDPKVPERVPPIRVRKSIPTSWIKMILTEGKNRQVRKMTAHVGFPTLRLIRYRIESITIDGLNSGEMKTLSKTELYNLLENKR